MTWRRVKSRKIKSRIPTAPPTRVHRDQSKYDRQEERELLRKIQNQYREGGERI